MSLLKNNRYQILKNKTALLCIGILLILSVCSIFAYTIIPDHTTNANFQSPLLAMKPPGHSQTFILRVKNIPIQKKGIITSLVSGFPSPHEMIPYDQLTKKENGLEVKFRNLVSFVSYHDLLDAINIDSSVFISQKGISYFDLSGNSKILTGEQIERGVQKHQIKKIYMFGTDKYGRDVFSRLILGLRVSLFVGLLSVFVSVSMGLLMGLTAGYYGSYVDQIIMFIINTNWSIPTLLLAFAIILAMGKGLLVIIFAIGLTMWVDVARISRGQVLQIKNELFIKSSKLSGIGDLRIIFKHILPNIQGPLLVIAAANFATAILVESGLSYLGLGIQPPAPSLGNMLNESYAFATGGYVYLAIFPIITIMILVLSFNLLGTSLRDVNDIKNSK